MIRLYVDGQLEGTENVGTASINNIGRDLCIVNSALNTFQTHETFNDLRIDREGDSGYYEYNYTATISVTVKK